MTIDGKLAGVVLRVKSPEELAKFYIQNLGMTFSRKEGHIRLGYAAEEAYLEFRRAQNPIAYTHDANDRYWKIGITLPDIDLAHLQLSAKGVNVTQPRQFKDIGYLCHLTDPEGFQIELLQHSFAGQPRTSEGDETLPMGGGARLGQITLRTSDIIAELDYYRDQLGMTLLSIQPVPDYNFDLYFLAFTDEKPPIPDLTAMQNRPWLWQRPYTLLEIQHRLNSEIDAKPKHDAVGFEQVIIAETT